MADEADCRGTRPLRRRRLRPLAIVGRFVASVMTVKRMANVGIVVEDIDAAVLERTGNGGPLAPEILARLVPALRAHPTTLVLLAYVGEVPVGIATCFLGFSTFAARPLVNVHDLAVLPEHRGRGIGAALLRAVEVAARERGCVKVTLEVQENNLRARRVYERAGLAQAGSGTATGGALFFSKSLTVVNEAQPAGAHGPSPTPRSTPSGT